jgi:hypothetical protein
MCMKTIRFFAFLTLFLTLFGGGMTFAATSIASNEPDSGLMVTQKPAFIQINVTQEMGHVIFKAMAQPVLMACGTVSDLPYRGWFDDQTMNLEFTDYQIAHTPSYGQSTCHAGYRPATQTIKIPNDVFETREVRTVRLWYKGKTISISVVQSGHMAPEFIMPTVSTGMFRFDHGDGF